MQHVLDAEKGRVFRYELPGLNALNFILENALGAVVLQACESIRRVKHLHNNYWICLLKFRHIF